MRLVLIVTCVVCLLLLKSCGEDIPKEYPYKPPEIIWKTKLADTGLLRDLVEADIQYNDGILFSGINNTTRSLYFLSATDGEKKWVWSDYMGDDVFWLLRSPYQFGSYLLIPEGRNLYCINLENGTTIWKRRMESFASEDVAFGNNEDFFLVVDHVNNNDTFEGRIAKGNITISNEPTLFLTPEYSRKVVQPQNGLAGTLDGVVSVEINGTDHLLIFFGDPNEALYDIDMFIGLYNLDEQAWVYSKKPSVSRAKSRCGRQPIVSGNKVFNFCGFTLVCHDLATGDLCWSKTIQEQPFSVMGLVDKKIIINSQDQKTRCINPDNGDTIWEIQTSGNPSMIRELNGLAYFIGGNGRFYAIDVDSGKVAWDFASPDLNNNPPAYFMQGVRVVKGSKENSDKVLVASEINAFCYDAAR